MSSTNPTYRDAHGSVRLTPEEEARPRKFGLSVVEARKLTLESPKIPLPADRGSKEDMLRASEARDRESHIPRARR